MAYVSPGGAFANSFSDAMALDAAQRRQSMLDALHTKQVESEIASGQAALAEKRQEHADKIAEQKRKDTISDVGALAIGDVPDADLIARAKEHHIPLRTVQTGGPVDTPIPQQFGQTATDVETPKPTIRFAGSPKMADEKKKQDRVDAIIAQVPSMDPHSPDFKRAAIEYEMITGKTLPAALLSDKAAATGEEAVMRQSPKSGKVERLTPQGWVEWNTDVPKGAHWMTEPPPKDTSAKDARKSAQVQSLHEAAVRELDGWTKQTQGEVEVLRKLDPMLNAPTPITDRLVSPEVLKLIVAGQGSGFRMTRAEIDNITHGRSRWEDLNQAIVQWSTDPTKALALSDTQRADLKSLAAEERRRANKVGHQVIDARTEFDDAMLAEDPTRLNKARTKLQQQFLSLEDEGGGGDTGGSDNRTHYDLVNGKPVLRAPKGK